MKKILLVSILLVFVSSGLFASIGVGDFSVEAKKGWAFYFNTVNTYAVWEPMLKIYLENQGLGFYQQWLETNPNRKNDLIEIQTYCRNATAEQIAAIKAAIAVILGL